MIYIIPYDRSIIIFYAGVPRTCSPEQMPHRGIKQPTTLNPESRQI
jgi:hypothetical protein